MFERFKINHFVVYNKTCIFAVILSKKNFYEAIYFPFISFLYMFSTVASGQARWNQVINPILISIKTWLLKVC